jgi:3D (Asp-Asp-Asp) domain-containing protein
LLFIPFKSYGQNFTNKGNFKATSYCLSGITKQGHSVRRGIIAVDQSIIPLNSVVYIEYPVAARGYYLASDTGRLIKGNIIDIWVPTCNEAIHWGRRSVKLVVDTKVTRELAPKLKRGAVLTNLKVTLGTQKRLVP